MNDVDIHSLCLELTMRYEFVVMWMEEVKYQRGKQVHNLCFACFNNQNSLIAKITRGK